MRMVVLLTASLIGLCQAETCLAKVVRMEPLDQNTVLEACERAGFPPTQSEGSYGCAASSVSIVCTDDGGCEAHVGDVKPLTGNSLRAVLQAMKEVPSVRLQGLDARVQPAADDRTAQTMVPSVATLQRVEPLEIGTVEDDQVPDAILGRVGAGAAPTPGGLGPAY